MKKIMFNDKNGLTQAVLEGRKTQTRRIVPTRIINYTDTCCLINDDKSTLKEHDKDYNCYETSDGDWIDIRTIAPYKIGEEVAVAQSYVDVLDYNFLHHATPSVLNDPILKDGSYKAGKENKMFVKAIFMPHRIKITNIRVERLQDISEEDCLKEGIIKMYDDCNHRYVYGCITGNKKVKITPSAKVEVGYGTPQEAFAYLIDKTCGKGTWQSNPWVFVYDFSLIK